MLSKVHSASRPDAFLISLLTALVLLAWYTMWLWGRSPYAHLLLHGPVHVGMAHSPWLFATVFVAGWTLMTVAMMLPTSFPMILLFRRIIGDRTAAPRLLALLVLGYLVIWIGCGALLHLVNWALNAGISRLSLPVNARWISAAFILAIAGFYQFSSLKYACLDKCRSPLSFLMSRWQGGNESAQALRIGMDHGLFCVGCCWSIMFLMFLVNTGSLVWMLLLGAVMALEKNFPWGRRMSAAIGMLLLIGAMAVVVNGIRSWSH
jgi:predicted metal-binding membrane protein